VEKAFEKALPQNKVVYAVKRSVDWFAKPRWRVRRRRDERTPMNVTSDRRADFDIRAYFR